jgi:hypothetical protein
MIREDTYNVRASVDGVDLGTFDKMSGGELDSEETTFRPGALQQPITLGGAQTFENVTVSKLYTDVVHNQFHWLASRRGKAEMIITRQPLDAEGNASGRVIVYSGKLKAVNLPEIDSEGNDAALLELEMTCRSIS